MKLPQGSHVSRTEGGSTLALKDERGEEIRLLYEIHKTQGLTAKTSAEFMKRSISSGEEGPVKELSFGVDGFPVSGIEKIWPIEALSKLPFFRASILQKS